MVLVPRFLLFFVLALVFLLVSPGAAAEDPDPGGGAPAPGLRTVRLKSAPAGAALLFNGREHVALRSAGGIRDFALEGEGLIRITAAGHRSREFRTGELAVLLRDGLLQIKLERDVDLPRLLQEIPTGDQPKSAYFSPEGDRIFVPLLNEPGVDVFRVDPASGGAGVVAPPLRHERRLLVPAASASSAVAAGAPPVARRIRGFVEALCDGTRRELWVSNMTENKIHIWDLDTLEYKTGFSSGGTMPKVLVMNPAGDTVAVSNWLSQNVAFFDAATKTPRGTVPVGGTPRGMAFSPDGALLYTAIFDEPVIAVIDSARKTVIRRIRLYPGEGAARHILLREGNLYVSDMYRGTVNIVDAAGGRLLKSLRVGPNINTIVLSPDGLHLAASSRGRNNPADYTLPGPDFGSVTLLRTADLAVEARIWGRNQPTGLAISPDGTLMVFTDFLDRNLELYRIR
jgi:DNA-binding beta-propeller fold protein YncE